MTLLPLKDVLTDKRLLRKVRAWCPRCYEDWNQEGKPIYEPLLWSMNVVTACLPHKRLLQNECINCNKQFPALSYNSRPGFCRHCNLWLGATHHPVSAEDGLLANSQLKWQAWVVDHLGTIFTSLRETTSPLKTEAVKHLVSLCLQRSTRGDVVAFTRQFTSFSYSAVSAWSRGTALPELSRLMDLCYQTEVSMKDVLFGRGGMDYTAREFMPIRSKDSYYVTTTDVARMEAALNLMLKEVPPPSQKEAAARLGCHVLTFKQHLPQLFVLIRERYLAFKAECFDREKIKASLTSAKEDHPPSSLDSVVKKLNCSRSFLRRNFPDDCRVISARYYEFRKVFMDLEEVRIKLQSFQSEFPPLPIIKCAERLGCTRVSLRRRFPEICRAIGARYYDYYRESAKQRREQRRETILETYTALKAEGINPNMYQIKKRLPHMPSLSNREIKAVFHWIACQPTST